MEVTLSWEQLTMHDENFRKDLGQRIKTLRKRRALSQKELAAKVGVGLSVLNRYESGIHAPPVEVLALLGKHLETTLDFLIVGEEPQGAPLHSKRLLERLADLQELNEREQDMVVELIDAVVAKKRVESAVTRRRAV
jgi:transcriptional regulator with XRE-family HTH domain